MKVNELYAQTTAVAQNAYGKVKKQVDLVSSCVIQTAEAAHGLVTRPGVQAVLKGIAVPVGAIAGWALRTQTSFRFSQDLGLIMLVLAFAPGLRGIMKAEAPAASGLLPYAPTAPSANL